MQSLLQDLRFGLRLILKHPGFASIAIATLALGIGVNTIVFTVANEILFEQFPFAHADRILYTICTNSNAPERHQDEGVSYPDYLDWRAQAHTFQALAALSAFQASLSDNQTLPQTYRAISMTSNTLRLLGQKPAVGRDFVSADDGPGASPVVILSYGLWQRRYGGDPAIVGRTIRIDSNPTTVVGVMPSGFQFPFNDELWVPLIPTADLQKRGSRTLFTIGRMADGVRLSSVFSEMKTISRRLEREYPETNQGVSAFVQTYPQFFLGPDLQTILEAMLAAVAFVLLIACANVANLLLGRGVARSREISIRIALGAERFRIVRQLLAESVLLSLIGAVFAWLIALAGLRTCALATAPFNLAPWINFSMDSRAFFYLAFLSVATGIFFGLVPAFRLAKVDMHSALKEGGRGSSVGPRDKLLTQSLVVAEIALALILLVGAGLTIRTFLGVYTAHLGVGRDNILTMRLPLSPTKYARPDQKIAFHTRLLARLQALPGVENVAITNLLPTGGSVPYPYELEGAAPVPVRPTIFSLVISPDYFRVLNLPILLGRAFTEVDGASGPPVVIVNQRFAEQTWKNQNPLGKRLRIFDSNVPGNWLIVVGVAPNIVQNEISPTEIDSLIYIPFREKPEADMALIASTRVPPGSLATSFRREVQNADPDLSVYNLWTLHERLERNYWFFGFVGSLFAGFAAVALLIASVGLYAVVAHSVGRRTQEIGVRMALGASPNHILRLIFRESLREFFIGLAIGLVGAFLLTRFIKTFLVQVSPIDPLTFGGAAFILLLAGVLGCLIPARRATAVDPIVALRAE